MPRPLKPLSLLLLSFFFPAPAWAIDPFTIIAAGAQAVNTVQSIAGASKDAAELSASLSVLSELIAEIDSDAGQSSNDDRINERLQEVERLAFEVGYTQDEVADLLSGSRESSQSLSETLGKIVRSVRLAKRLAALAGISTQKAAEVAQIEQNRSINDEKKILTEIHSQMVRSELERKHEELAKQKQVTDEVAKLREFLGGISPNGNLRLFPASQVMVRKAIEVFRAYARYLLLFVGVIFFGRLLYYEFTFAPPEKYTDLLKDTCVCFFLMLVFPVLYTYMAEYSDALALKLSQVLKVSGPTMPTEPKRLFGLALPWWIQPAVVQSVIYLLVYSLFNLVIAVLIAVGPIAILAGTLLNFSISLPAYFAALLLIWLWPVVWNIVGFFADLLWRGKDWSGSGIAEAVAALIFWVFQLLSPLALYKHLSRSQVGQALQGAVRGAVAAPAQSRVAIAGAKAAAIKVAAPAVAAAAASKQLVSGRTAPRPKKGA